MLPVLYYNDFWQYELVFIGRLLLALLLGGLIGMERQHKRVKGDKQGKGTAAGFRTHILVCVGSCIFMLVSISMPMVIYAMPEGIVNNADPGRIAAQVVSGIGFLGAGAILQGKGRVHGLTTAASLWVVAAIGLATGAGLYLTAIAATLLTFMILSWFSHLEERAARLMEKQAEERAKKKICLDNDDDCVTEDYDDCASLQNSVEQQEDARTRL